MSYTVSFIQDKFCVLQDKLNVELTGNHEYLTDLLSNMDDGKKQINYGKCILSEINELMDSTPWKHWKKGELDRDNLEIEIVDLFHFVPSMILVLENLIGHKLDPNQYEASNGLNMNRTRESMDKYKDNELDNFIIMIGSIQASTAMSICESIHSGTIEKNIESNSRFLFNLVSLYSFLETLVIYHHIKYSTSDEKESLHRIYALYLVKNTVNRFRNDNGYKEGTYIKMWSEDREDNSYAMEILLENPMITSENLYEELDNIYKTI